MDSRDRAYLAQALAKAAAQPGVSAATIEQCIYQIGLVLARDSARFKLGDWCRQIEARRAALGLPYLNLRVMPDLAKHRE